MENGAHTKKAAQSWLHSLLWVAGIFALSRVLIFGIGIAAHVQMVPRMQEDAFQWTAMEEVPLLNMWGPWDTGWYLSIAKDGYSSDSPFNEAGEVVYRNYAFFPAYPMLVKWLSKPFGEDNLFVIGLLFSNLLAVAAFWLVFLICRRLFDKEGIARNVIILLSFFPNSFIFSSFYTESLFMFLLAAWLLSALHRHWWLAAACGALLSATRVNGFTVALPVVILIIQAYPEILRGRVTKGSASALASLVLYPTGLVAFMIYLKFHTGDPFAFLAVSSAWERQPGFYFHRMFTDLGSGRISGTYLALYTLVGFSLIQYLLYKKQYILYILAMTLALPAFLNGIPHNPFTSMPRYLLPIFSIPIALALILRDKPTAFAIVLAILATLNGMLVVYWVTGMSMVT